MNASQRQHIVDLSHPLRNGMPMAPGLPGPHFEPYLTRQASRASYDGRAEFEITRLFLLGNTGTSLDSPFHRRLDGLDVAGLPLQRLVCVPGFCLNAGPWQAGMQRALRADLPAGSLAGSALLIRTGWDRRWGQPDYWANGPFLGSELVHAVSNSGAALVGVDFANVDDRHDPARPAHTELLAAGLPIVENLRGLEVLPARGFRLHAAPLAIESASAVPVRVLAELGLGWMPDGGF